MLQFDPTPYSYKTALTNAALIFAFIFCNNHYLNGQTCIGTNLGFESQTSGWVLKTGLEEIAPGTSHSGTSSIYLNRDGEQVTQTFSAIPGTFYKLSGWGQGNDAGWSGLGMTFLDASANELAVSAREVTSSNSFEKYTMSAVAPTGAVRVSIWGAKSGADGYLYLDDFCLSTGQAPDPLSGTLLSTCDLTGWNPGSTGNFLLALDQAAVGGLPSGWNQMIPIDGGLQLIQYQGGSAHVAGSIAEDGNPCNRWEVDIWLINGTDWTNWSNAGRTFDSTNCALTDHPFYTYYEIDPASSWIRGTYGHCNEGKAMAVQHTPTDYSKGIQVHYPGSGATCESGLSIIGNIQLVGDVNVMARFDGRGSCQAGAICNDVTDPGQLQSDESGCLGYDPQIITELSPATGGKGGLEYMWIENTVLSIQSATVIPNSDFPIYDPGPISETTYYRRCVRRVGCTGWNESNWIKKEVVACGGAGSWDFSCGGSDFIYFKGKNFTGPVVTQNILGVNFLDSVLVECVITAGSTIPEKVVFTSPTDTIEVFESDLMGGGNRVIYRAIFPPTTFVKTTIVGGGANSYQSLNTYCFFNGGLNQDFANNGKIVNALVEPGDSHSESVNIPTSIVDREVYVSFMINELASDGSVFNVTLSAGPVSRTFSLSVPFQGAQLGIFYEGLFEVPGNISTVDVTISSPNSNGQSLVWSGLNVLSGGCSGTVQANCQNTFITLGSDEIDFVNVTYNYPVQGQSTWYYAVRPGPTASLSHLDIALNLNCMNVEDAGTWGPQQTTLNSGLGFPFVGRDSATGITGIRFGQNIPAGGESRYYFVLDGNYLLDPTIVIGSKATNGLEVGIICGPSNDCDTSNCDLLITGVTITPLSNCNASNGTLTVTAVGGTGNLEYSINEGVTWQPLNTFFGLPLGFYQILARNTDGSCETRYPITVYVSDPNPVQPGLIVGDESQCGTYDPFIISNGQAPSVGGVGILEIRWQLNEGAGFGIIPGGILPSYDPGPITSTSTYIREARRVGCPWVPSNSVVKEIIAQPTISGTVLIIQPSCNNVNDGVLIASVINGTGNYEYSIDNGITWQALPTFTGLGSGSYTITVRNLDGTCPVTQSFSPSVLVNPAPVSISVNTQSPTSCISINGQIIITATGGSGPLEYSIDNGSTWQTVGIFGGLDGGNYQVKVRNISGNCETPYASNPVVLALPNLPVADAGGDKSMCVGTPVTLGGSPTASGGTTPLQILWFPNADVSGQNLSNPTANPLMTTTYTVQVTDANGCVDIDESTVSIFDFPIANAGNDMNVCLGQSAQIGGSPVGPELSTFMWSTGVGGIVNTQQLTPVYGMITVTPDSTTNYSVTITENGCSTTDDMTVTVYDPMLTVSKTDETDCQTRDGTLTFVVTNGSPPYDIYFRINNSPVSQGPFMSSPIVLTNMPPASYTDFRVVADGCASPTVPGPLVIEEGGILNPIQSQVDSDASACGLSDGSVTITVSANITNYTLTLTDLGTNVTTSYGPFTTRPVTIPNLPSAVYEIGITNQLGCTDTSQLGPIAVGSSPCCVDFNFFAFLEGGFDPILQEMPTRINAFGFLPGQIPQVGFFPTPTPTGQPYNVAPWFYAGNEGDNFGDGPSQTPYDPTVTDWVLVSLRQGGLTPADEVFRQAALMHNDGRVEFVGPCFFATEPGPYYIVVEHRNHAPAMSDARYLTFTPVGAVLTYDFRNKDSFSGLFTFGQKELIFGGGVYGLYGADGDKTGNENGEINGNDRSIWLDQNGVSEKYNQADFDLNVEVNGNDNSIWLNNNGIATGVPK